MASTFKDKALRIYGIVMLAAVLGVSVWWMTLPKPGEIPETAFQVLVHPEKYTPLMSSTPGLRLQAFYEGADVHVRYTASKGRLFTWDIPSRKISDDKKSLTASPDTPVYWGPSFDERSRDFAGENCIVSIALENKMGDTVAERRLSIVFSDNYYSVKPADYVVIGTQPEPAEGPQTLDEAVSLAVKGRSSGYLAGEVAVEGHIILESEEQDGQVKVYTIASQGNFGFENGIFTKVSGSGAIPTVITFTKNPDGGYSVADYQEPLDGAMLTESLKKMFPARLHDQVLSVSSERTEALRQQQVTQAREYLQSIGQEAEISYSHVDKTLIKINVDASNKLFAELTKYDQFLNDCPYWQGTREKVEDGVRYIYETSHSKTSDGYDLIIFQKKTEDGTIVQEAKYKIVGSEPQIVE